MYFLLLTQTRHMLASTFVEKTYRRMHRYTERDASKHNIKHHRNGTKKKKLTTTKAFFLSCPPGMIGFSFRRHRRHRTFVQDRVDRTAREDADEWRTVANGSISSCIWHFRITITDYRDNILIKGSTCRRTAIPSAIRTEQTSKVLRKHFQQPTPQDAGLS